MRPRQSALRLGRPVPAAPPHTKAHAVAHAMQDILAWHGWHGTRRYDLKRYAKRVLFRLILRYFGPKMRSLRPLIGYITHYTMMKGVCLSFRLVPMQMDPFTHIHPNCPKKGIFWPFLTDFETEVRHLRIPLPVATVEFLAQTSCDCTSHP